MKEIDKLMVASAIVTEWGSENYRDHNDEHVSYYTEAARAVEAMHALSALFSLRGEDAPPVEKTFFNMFAEGIAKAMNKEQQENDTPEEKPI